MHLRFMHSIYVIVILKALLGPRSSLNFDWFRQRQETASLAAQAGGRFTQQKYPTFLNLFLSTALLFFSKQLLPMAILSSWQNQAFLKRSGRLWNTIFKDGCHPELPIRGMFFHREMGLIVISWVVSFVMELEPKGCQSW